MTEPPLPPPYRTGKVEFPPPLVSVREPRPREDEQDETPRQRFRVIDDTVRGSIRRLAWAGVGLVAFVLVIVLVGTVASALMRMSAPELPRLNELANSSTGLPDGTYVLIPEEMLLASDGCAFTGLVEGAPEAGEVVLAGQGLAECGVPNEGEVRNVEPSASRIEFVVQNGVAQIARLSSEVPAEMR